MNASEFTLGQSLLAILPEIGLAVMAAVILFLDLYLPESRRRNIAIVSGISLGLLALLPLIFYPGSDAVPQGMYWGGMVRYDSLAQIFKFMVLVAAAITSLMTIDVKGVGHKGEFYIVLIVSSLGMTLMAGAADLIMVFLALETTSIPLYILAAFKRNDNKSSESGMKYFLFGSFASAILLYGLSLLYGFTGQTNLTLLAQYLGTDQFASNPIPAL